MKWKQPPFDVDLSLFDVDLMFFDVFNLAVTHGFKGQLQNQKNVILGMLKKFKQEAVWLHLTDLKTLFDV